MDSSPGFETNGGVCSSNVYPLTLSQFNETEQKKTLKSFRNPVEIYQNGFMLSGSKFGIRRAEEDSVLGRDGVGILVRE